MAVLLFYLKFATRFYPNREGEPPPSTFNYSRDIATRNPKNANGYMDHGNLHADRGETDNALADYNSAISLDPSFAMAYLNRGNLYAAKGDVERALADYDRAILLQADYPAAYLDRGNVYGDKGDSERAFADYDKALALDPDFIPAYIARGEFYQQQGCSELAIEDYNKAFALSSNDPNVYVRLGSDFDGLEGKRRKQQSAFKKSSNRPLIRTRSPGPSYNCENLRPKQRIVKPDEVST